MKINGVYFQREQRSTRNEIPYIRYGEVSL